MKHIKSYIVLGLLLVSFGAIAQNQNAIRLNEVLVINENDFQDDFGQQNAWFELFNSSFGTVDVGGCFLSDDINNLQKYRIPKGDITTKIKPRQHALFWADCQPNRGTYHVSFNLEPGRVLYFVAGDGRTIIDQITIPDLAPNQSYGRTDDGLGTVDGSGEGWEVLSHTSPSGSNGTVDGETKSQKMARIDPYGWIMAVTAMSVVFSALIILYLIFKQIGKASIRRSSKKTASSNASDEVKAAAAEAAKTEGVSGEVFAAISTAFHLYCEENEAHDEESFVVTLQHTDRSYSPWSSKIYQLRETPQLKRK